MVAGTSTAREGKPSRGVPTLFPWAGVIWFAALLFASYAPVLIRLVRQWATDEDMGHGFFVPLVAAYILWKRRSDLLDTKPVRNWWGLAIIGWGALQLYVATLGAELFLARTAFILTLTGMVLFLGGWPVLRIAAFPLFLLCFMVPIPAIIYNQITLPLQFFASHVAEVVLSALGVPVIREGNILDLANQRLDVVEACSGIRSLLTLSFLSLVYAYFFDKKVWMRPVLLVLTIPIAILANASRVTITGLLSEANPELAEGLFHTASGWVIFMIALLMLIVVHAAINRIYSFVHARK